jgi:hypothetical protein
MYYRNVSNVMLIHKSEHLIILYKILTPLYPTLVGNFFENMD